MARWALALGFAALAFVIRALPWPTVLAADRTYLTGTDAWYHMRRVLYTLVRFPETLGFDPYLNFPHGARAIWPPAFDAVVATLLRPFWQPGGEAAVERLVVWIPPLIGAACVASVVWIADRWLDRRAAVVSGALLCVLHGHFWYSQIGFLDHHAAVAWLAALLLAASFALSVRLVTDDAFPVAAATATGALVGVLLGVWPGSLIHVGLAQAVLVALLFTRRDAAAALRVALVLAWVHSVAFLLLAPAGLGSDWAQWGRFSPVVLSWFQPWLCAAAALCGLTCALLWRGEAAPGRGVRAGQAAAVGLMVLGASGVLFPDGLSALRDAWTWAAKDEVFQSMVAESAPLFEVAGRASRVAAELELSRLVYLIPLFALALAVGARRARAERAVVLASLGLWLAGLAALTLAQRRFVNSLAVVLALAAAWSVVRAWDARPAALRTGSGRVAALTAALLLAAFLLYPTVSIYAAHLKRQPRAFAGEPLGFSPMILDQHAWVAAGEWLRANTPETAGFFDSSAQPEYGVMAFWDMGHVLRYTARRPMVTDNFGDDAGARNFRLSMRYFSETDEARAAALLDRLGARYVVARPVKLGRGDVPTLIERLADGGAGLEYHRLLWSAPPSPGPDGRRRVPVRIYERVRRADGEP